MKKILAIDDQRDNLVSIEGFLRNFLPDCKLYLAQSGKEGIAIALKEQPDTILLDIIMPEMDGYEVCKILKQDKRTKFIPILFLSALGQDQESRVRGLELGADAFLAKPFIPTELRAQINVMLRIKEAEDKLREEKDVLEVAVSKKIIELKQSEETYRTLLNNLNSAVVVHSPDTSVKYANPTACKLLGLSEDQLKGKKAIDPQWKFLRDDQSDMPLEEFPVNQVLSMNEPLRNFVVGVKRSKNKDIVWALVNGYSLLDDSGKIVEVIINFIDISERKQAEEDLKESERRISTLINNLQGIAYRCNNDEDWTMEFISAGIEEITGYAPEDIIDNKNFSFNDIIIPEDRDRIWKVIRSAIGKNELFEINYQIKTASGETKYLSEKGAGIFDEHDGKLIALEGFINDVTEQVIANKAIQASEERFKRLFDGLGDAVFVTKVGGKDKGRILEVNSAATVQTGFTRDELLKLNIISDLYVEGSGEISSEIWEEKLNKGEIVTTIEKKKKKDGTDYWTEMIVTRIEFMGEIASLSINHDITNRKRAELIQRVLYNISNAVIVEDNLKKLIGFIRKELGQVIDTNNFYVALYDQKTDTLSLPFIVDEVEERTNIPAGKTLTYYVINTQKSLLANKKRIKELEDSGHIGTFGAESEVWLGVPLKIEGKVTGVLAIQSYTNENAYNESDLEMLEFVTEQISISIMRKKAEEDLKNALKKATESDRLKSAFLATISHELRTPLNAIIGFSDLINKDWPIDEIIGFGKTINQSGAHLLSIVEEIFDITLIESGEITINYKRENLHITLNDIHKTIKSQQRILNKEGIELRMVIPENEAGLIINTDIAKLKQVLVNLLKNALKFTHTGHINFGYSFIENGDKKMLKFYVEDTGIGVPIDKQEMIFTTFRQVEESLSKTYGGTGIGLSISKKLTELLGGRIWIESTFGKGSTFYFTIPIEMPETDNQQYQIGFVDEATTVSRKPKSANEKTFLIVEDDETSFEFLQIVLEKPGTTIIWAKNGEEAVEYCKNVNHITLVLMDINMDVMDGYDATKEIKKMHPELPIIAQTANAIAGDREKTIKAGCDDYISKPINIEDLMDKIEKLI